MPTTRNELNHFLNDLLDSAKFADYGPNGLQVEGKETIHRIAFAVSATRASIETAVQAKADALIVHHGLFWSFHGPRTITGPFAQRLLPLIDHRINCFAYHLPLDGHAEIGNAACLGRLIGLDQQQAFGDYKGCATGVQGSFSEPLSARQLQDKLAAVLDHAVILASPDAEAIIQRVGIITGGANSEWQSAAKAGLDAYISGEISEHDWHESQEAGIHMFAGGHHATEQFGIQALMAKIAESFALECFYIDSDNPA